LETSAEFFIDALGRSAGKTIEVGGAKIAEEKLSYVKLGDHATSMPSTLPLLKLLLGNMITTAILYCVIIFKDCFGGLFFLI